MSGQVLNHFYLDIDARGQIQIREGFHDARGGIQYLHEPLMDPQFELFARVLVDEGRTVHGVALDLRRQRNRTDHRRIVAFGGLNDTARGRIDQFIIVRFDPQPHFLGKTRFLFCCHDGL